MGKRWGVTRDLLCALSAKPILVLTLYAKAKRENIPAHILQQLKEAFEHE